MASGDIYFASVSLLLHCEGSNNGTTFTDSSSSAKSVTAANGAITSTAQYKWGTASAYFDGTDANLSVPNSTDLIFGTGDFTIEFWIRANKSAQTQSYPRIIGKGNFSEQGGWNVVYFKSSGEIGIDLYGATTVFVSAGNVTDDTWTHVAFTRQSGTVRAFRDGTLINSGTSTQDLYITRALAIGAEAALSSDYLGYLDDIRLTKGVARYTATFTALTEAFPDYLLLQARSSADGPLAAAQPLARHLIGARSSAAGPLGEANVVASDTTLFTRASAAGPLGATDVLAVIPSLARSDSPGPLGAQLVLAKSIISARSSADGPLGSALAKAWNDSLINIPLASETIYTCDLVNGATTTRLPISSWQATIQTGAASYVQVVVPGAADYADAIADALASETAEFVINRGARLSDGTQVESEMARAPLTTVTTDRGPNRYTATLSGYADAWTPDPSPPASATRTLTQIRSISTTNGLPRVRCAIDWLLQPGLTAVADDVEFTVGYINFYATSEGDTYCDVGESATT